MSEPIAGTNLTTVVEFNETALALSDLRERYKGLVVDVQTPKGLKEAKTFTFELRTLRTTLEKRRKDLKAPIIERGKQLDDEAKRITAEIVALEEPIDVQIKAEEARIENARLVKLEADRRRVEAIQQKIQTIRDVPGSLVGKPSVIIAGQLKVLRETVLDEAELGEYYVMATDALTAATARVEQQLAAQHEAESEKKRQAERDAEMEAMRVKMAEQQRLIDEAKEAKRVEQERLAQVEQDRVAAEERAAREAEQRRLQSITAGIEAIKRLPPDIGRYSEAELREELAALDVLNPFNSGFDFQEFYEEACAAWGLTKAIIEDWLEKRVATDAYEEQQRVEQAERERQQAEEDARLQAERERQAAEQRKLDEQAAQLKREQQAAKAAAERVRLANLGLREAAQAVVDHFMGQSETTPMCVRDLEAALVNDVAQAKPARAKRAAQG